MVKTLQDQAHTIHRLAELQERCHLGGPTGSLFTEAAVFLGSKMDASTVRKGRARIQPCRSSPCLPCHPERAMICRSRKIMRSEEDVQFFLRTRPYKRITQTERLYQGTALAVSQRTPHNSNVRNVAERFATRIIRQSESRARRPSQRTVDCNDAAPQHTAIDIPQTVILSAVRGLACGPARGVEKPRACLRLRVSSKGVLIPGARLR